MIAACLGDCYCYAKGLTGRPLVIFTLRIKYFFGAGISSGASFTRTCLGGRARWAGFSKDDRAKGVTGLRARKSCLVRNAI